MIIVKTKKGFDLNAIVDNYAVMIKKFKNINEIANYFIETISNGYVNEDDFNKILESGNDKK